MLNATEFIKVDFQGRNLYLKIVEIIGIAAPEPIHQPAEGEAPAPARNRKLSETYRVFLRSGNEIEVTGEAIETLIKGLPAAAAAVKRR